MPARLRYSTECNAPHLAAVAVGAAIARPIEHYLSSLRVRWLGAQGRADVLYLALHRDMLIGPAAFSRSPETIRRPVMLGHDGLASRITHELAPALGLDGIIFRRRSSRSPGDQIAELARQVAAPLCVFTDSGGPYGIVRPGTLRLARSLGYSVVPTVAEASATVLALDRVVVPAPWATIWAVVGPPVDPALTTPEDLGVMIADLRREMAHRRLAVETS